MPLVFFDTEFTDLVSDARLISIGLVADDGERTFYAELAGTYRQRAVGKFARQHVIPMLEGETARMTMEEASARLSAWLEGFGEPVKLATDSLSWDAPMLSKVLKDAWPSNVDRLPLLLARENLRDYDKFSPAVEAAYAAGLRRHHALDDAKANRIGWLAAGGGIFE